MANASSCLQKKKRFSVIDDLNMLREVVGKNPYADTSKWSTIADTVNQLTGKGFSVRAVRERTEYLLRLFRKEDVENLRKSGTEEQYQEKERLLQGVSDIAKEFGGIRRTAANIKAAAARDAALLDTEHEKRSRDEGDLDFLERRAAREHAAKQRQLDLDERRLELEERRLRLEEERFAFERERFREVELAKIRLEEERERSQGQLLQALLNDLLRRSNPVQ